MKKILKYGLVFFSVAIILLLIAFYFSIQISPPNPESPEVTELDRIQISKDFYTCGSGWMKKNKKGLWEMYLEGNGFERGVIRGKLSKELMARQEEYFVNQIYKILPSKAYINFLKYFLAWFNRDIDEYIDEEYRQEIYGISLYTPDKYDYIAPKYQRLLNYHAAHDVGHALQNMNMVGCTSFSAWDDKTADSTLLIARNFDFYFGDDFSKEKIICFVNPDEGLKFMMVSWAGMVGAVSGMNEKGLTVTINAAKSGIPSKAATPITIVVRKILQYAGDIEEAQKIAEGYETFVSESIMIGSAADNKTAIIEKTPEKTAVFESPDHVMICSNHFQSALFEDDELNVENINTSDSPYRFERMTQIVAAYDTINVKNAIAILRERQGVDDKNIGLGNQKAINQLIAHHSIVFKPEQLKFWVSTYPFQLGSFVAYDMNEVFDKYSQLTTNMSIIDSSASIPADSFLFSKDYQLYKKHRMIKSQIEAALKDDVTLTQEAIDTFILGNPEYYGTYALLGDLYAHRQDCEKSKEYYALALTKEVATKIEEETIEEKLNSCPEN